MRLAGGPLGGPPTAPEGIAPDGTGPPTESGHHLNKQENQ